MVSSEPKAGAQGTRHDGARQTTGWDDISQPGHAADGKVSHAQPVAGHIISSDVAAHAHGPFHVSKGLAELFHLISWCLARHDAV